MTFVPTPLDRFKISLLRRLIGLPPFVIAVLLCLGLRQRFRTGLKAYTLQLKAEPFSVKTSVEGLLPHVSTLLICFFEAFLRLLLAALLCLLIFYNV